MRSNEKTDRNKEMKRLRFDDGWKLEDIAKKFNISRERVRQIIGNTGINFRTKWTEKQIPEYNLDGASSMDGLPGVMKVWRREWKKYRHLAVGGMIQKGQTYEGIASQLLDSKGIKNTLMVTMHPFDILLENGKRVDVKHSTFDISTIETQRYASPTYPIAHTKCGKDCDFFVIFLPDPKQEYAVFVIPSSEIKTDRIRIPYPQMGKKPSKWVQYKDRFDLLNL